MANETEKLIQQLQQRIKFLEERNHELQETGTNLVLKNRQLTEENSTLKSIINVAMEDMKELVTKLV